MGRLRCASTSARRAARSGRLVRTVGKQRAERNADRVVADLPGLSTLAFAAIPPAAHTLLLACAPDDLPVITAHAPSEAEPRARRDPARRLHGLRDRDDRPSLRRRNVDSRPDARCRAIRDRASICIAWHPAEPVRKDFRDRVAARQHPRQEMPEITIIDRARLSGIRPPFRQRPAVGQPQARVQRRRAKRRAQAAGTLSASALLLPQSPRQPEREAGQRHRFLPPVGKEVRIHARHGRGQHHGRQGDRRTPQDETP